MKCVLTQYYELVPVADFAGAKIVPVVVKTDDGSSRHWKIEISNSKGEVVTLGVCETKESCERRMTKLYEFLSGETGGYNWWRDG